MIKWFITFCVLTSFHSYSQNDTLIRYLDKNWQETKKDSAVFRSLMYREGDKFKWKQYSMQEDQLEFEGLYADPDKKKAVGEVNQYMNGKLYHTKLFDNDGYLISGVFYYPNGSKNSEIIWNGNKVIKEIGWDEQGNEIKGFVVLREAKFKGGPEGWRMYLQENLRVRVAEDAGMPSGTYTTVVEFLVDKEGKVSEAVGRSKQPCRPCAEECVRVIERGPKWIPAIMNNKPVLYRQKQSITILVN
jgi:hypothetical protein